MALVIAVLAGGVTILTGFTPFLQFAYRSPSAHVAIETAATVIALVTAYFAWGRFRHSRLPADLALSFSLATVSLTRLAFTGIPQLFDFHDADRFSTWSSLAGSVVGTAALALAAFVPDRPLARPLHTATRAAAAGVLGLTVIGVAFAVSASRLPVGIDPALSPSTASPAPGNPAILAVQFVLAVLLLCAAIGFNRRAVRGEEFYTWLSAGATVGGFARVNYILFPSLYSDWVYTGDVLRLTFYLLLLVAVLREIGAYQTRIAESAALEERRRLARDYHDGIAQELAFIVARLQGMTRQYGFLEPLRAASERALQECRWAISALTVAGGQALSTALVETAEEIAAREGTRLELEIDPNVDVPRETREALLRIVSEAMTNAARHGRARTVHVELMNGDGTILRVRDDGDGFEVRSAEGGGGFGLMSMRERVQAVGGEIRVTSQAGAGTLIEVRVP
jgi:signal transduction histidine kinase